MKRGRDDYTNEELDAMEKYFVVVKGKTPGIYSAFHQFDSKDCVYRQFYKSQKKDAVAWYQRSLSLPVIDKLTHALTIHTSGRNFDVSQERDHYAAFAVRFHKDEQKQSFCLPVNRDSSISDCLAFIAFIKALEMARTDIPLRMYTDSKQIAYGINYGLKEWPKHDFNANMKPALWAQIVSLMAYRADLGQIITVDYEQKQNAAYMQTTTCCHAQSNGKIEYPKFAIARAQCITWILCANRLGFHRDVKRVIAKLVWGNRYRITIPYLSKDQF